MYLRLSYNSKGQPKNHTWIRETVLDVRQGSVHIFFNENVWISINISLKFVPKGPINNIPALVQIMAWRCLDDKPLSEPMMVSLLMHRCVTQPEWVEYAHVLCFLLLCLCYYFFHNSSDPFTHSFQVCIAGTEKLHVNMKEIAKSTMT